jgi:hypothetical protein
METKLQRGCMNPRAPVRDKTIEPGRAAQRRKKEPQGIKNGKKTPACPANEAESFRFDDPYWDEAFNSYYDPTLRTCCRI